MSLGRQAGRSGTEKENARKSLDSVTYFFSSLTFLVPVHDCQRAVWEHVVEQEAVAVRLGGPHPVGLGEGLVARLHARRLPAHLQQGPVHLALPQPDHGQRPRPRPPLVSHQHGGRVVGRADRPVDALARRGVAGGEAHQVACNEETSSSLLD